MDFMPIKSRALLVNMYVLQLIPVLNDIKMASSKNWICSTVTVENQEEAQLENHAYTETSNGK